jgi:hypothetical protein
MYSLPFISEPAILYSIVWKLAGWNMLILSADCHERGAWFFAVREEHELKALQERAICRLTEIT